MDRKTFLGGILALPVIAWLAKKSEATGPHVVPAGVESPHSILRDGDSDYVLDGGGVLGIATQDEADSGTFAQGEIKPGGAFYRVMGGGQSSSVVATGGGYSGSTWTPAATYGASSNASCVICHNGQEYRLKGGESIYVGAGGQVVIDRKS